MPLTQGRNPPHKTNKTENDHNEIGRRASSSEWSEEFAASEKKVKDFHPVTAGWNGWRFAKVAHRNLLANLGRLFMRREEGSARARPAGNYRQESSSSQLVTVAFIDCVWGSPSRCFCVGCSQYCLLLEKLVGSQAPMLKEWYWLVDKVRCNRCVRPLMYLANIG